MSMRWKWNTREEIRLKGKPIWVLSTYFLLFLNLLKTNQFTPKALTSEELHAENWAEGGKRKSLASLLNKFKLTKASC
jgi:hypothetical protein